MSRKVLLAVAVIAVNAAILMVTPKSASAQTVWGCGYNACAPHLVNVCVNDGGGSVCSCACDTPGAGGGN
jgi:hypothetical protein